jgi:hypothetical protein
VGHVLEGQADAEVAAGHHDSVGDGQDLVGLLDRRGSLDLRHHLGADGAERIDQALHVGGPLHERGSHRVGARGLGGAGQLEVAPGGAGDAPGGVGQVEPGPALQPPAALDHDVDTPLVPVTGRGGHHLEHHGPVAGDDAVAREQAQTVEVDADDLATALGRTAAQLEPVAGNHLDAPVGERRHAQLRPWQVDQHADRPVLVRAHPADPVDEGELGGGLAVGQVDADDVGAGGDHLPQDRLVPRGRSEGRHDLRSSHCLSFRVTGAGAAAPVNRGGVSPSSFDPAHASQVTSRGGRRFPRDRTARCARSVTDAPVFPRGT